MRSLRSSLSVVVTLTVCGIAAWAPLPTLPAQSRDVRLLEAVKRLLAAGGDGRAARWNGETALMIAAGAGSLDAVRQLAQAGADVNTAEPRGAQTALMWAAAEGHSDVVAGLVAMGANVNAASRAGFTPIVFAVVKDDAASIKALLAAGANPNVIVQSGAKTMIVAMQYKNTAAALALLEGG